MPATLLAAAAAIVAQPSPKSSATPAATAALFVAACVRHEGRAGPVIDWALARGFGPVSELPADRPPPLLLGSAAGTMLVMPGSAGDVLLAASEGDRCTVWAERQAGPTLRLALQRELDALKAQGARAAVQTERNLMHAGQWRNVMQWRYRAAGSVQELDIGAVTTLGGAAAEQALHLTPAGAAPGPGR